MCVHLIFNHEKATQCLNYFAQKNGGQINKLKALKLIYFADRYHFRKYGRFITNSDYYAMPHGPVASGVKDIAELSGDWLSEKESTYAAIYLDPIGTYDYESIAPIDEVVFSQSDEEALHFAWEKFGNLNRWELRDLTHKYPEWQRHKGILESELTTRIDMDLEDFVDDPEDDDIEKCFELDDSEKEDRREHLKELSFIEALWS